MSYVTPIISPYALSVARLIAISGHAGQKRWEGTDYFEHHCAVVAERVKGWGFGLYEQALALMHDVIEDTAFDLELLRSRLGDVMPAQFFTDLEALSHMEREPYARYLRRLIRTGSPSALRVKSADAQSNWLDLLRENYPEKHRQRGDKYALAILLVNQHHVLVTGELIPVADALTPFV